MATAAVGAKGSLVLVILLVAGHARSRRALVDVVGVATGADHLGMASNERERRLVMVECDIPPPVGGVATAAVGAKGPLVLVILLVAVYASGGRALVNVVGVTTGAGRLGMAADKREGRLVMVECDLLPIAGHVATGAVGAKGPLVLVILLVTAHTCGRRALVDIIDVATGADRLGVGTSEREGRLAMVECGDLLPIAGHVATSAVGAKGPLVLVILLVTVHASGGRALVDVVGVARGACRLGVGAGEREGGFVVVERDLLPRAGCVATGTVGAQGTLMAVILLMAAYACGGRPLVDVVTVATGADRLSVGAGERKRRLAMVECGNLLPIIGHVATGTVGAKLAEVLLRLGVAIHTRGGRTLVHIVGVAFCADHLDVSAGEREGRLAVVECREILPVASHVAACAFRAKLAEVYLRIGVTAHACGGRTLVDVVGVAFCADHLDVSAGEGKTRLAMVKRGLLPVGGHVATGAVGAKGTLVDIIALMAGDTGAISDLKIGMGAGIFMAEPATRIRVLAL